MDTTKQEFSQYKETGTSLWLFKKGISKKFQGSLSYFRMMQFIKLELIFDPVLFIKSKSQYKKVLKKEKYFFLYTGSKNSEALSHLIGTIPNISKTLVFYTTSTSVISKQKLKADRIYFITSSGNTKIEYTGEIHQVGIKEWTFLVLLNKYSMIQSLTYDRMKQTRTPVYVLMTKDSRKLLPPIESFVRFFETETIDHVIPRVCDLSRLPCKHFLARVGVSKFKSVKLPEMFLIKPSRKSSDDHLFWYTRFLQKNLIVEKNNYKTRFIKKFISQVKKNKLNPAVFSGKVPTVKASKFVKSLTFKTFKSFNRKIMNTSRLILFYDSRLCYQQCSDRNSDRALCNARKKVSNKSLACKKLENQFSLVVETMIQTQSKIRKVLEFGKYDLGENTFDFLEIKAKAPFVRLYKSSSKFVDLKIGKDHSALYGLVSEFVDLHFDQILQQKKVKSKGGIEDTLEVEL